VTGNGRAKKDEVLEAIVRICQDKFWPLPHNDDEADAIGLIVTYLKDTNQWRIGGKLQGADEPGADGTADGPVPF
jgi:Holliday junction resolvasome RuvABC endonuclease subunit